MKLTVLKNNVPINEVQVETPDLNELYEIFVGRSEDCHVIMDDPLISRHHFVIRNENGKWYCDKLSQLGLAMINGSPALKTVIQNGTEIKCGVYTVLVSNLPVPEIIRPSETVRIPVEEITPIQEHKELAPTATVQPEPVIEVEENNFEEPVQEDIQNSFESEDKNNENSEIDFSDSNGNDQGFDSTESNESQFVEESRPDEDSTRFFKTFVNYQLVIFGDYAPYDRYEIDANEIFIGRDPKKCQIVLDDKEVSSVHAVVRRNNAEIIVEDLNSSNGTIINGERINKASLIPGDEFLIGSTTFTLEVKSDLLEAESDRLMPVEENQVIETEEIQEEEVPLEEGEELNFASEAPAEKSIIKRIWKDPAQRKKLIYALAVGAVVMLFLPEEPETPQVAPAKKEEVVKKDESKEKPKLTLTKELETRRNVAYELGVDFFEQNKYSDALREFQVVASIDPEYKKNQTYLEQTKAGLKRLEELEAQRRAEEERIKNKKVIEELLVKARDAVKDHHVQVAESYFSQIAEKDPENIELQQLKMELEAWQKEEEKKALEKASREAARKNMVAALAPGKTYYLKKEWYLATLKLEEFLRKSGMDEDLIKEASDMLSDAKNQLSSELGPVIGKARSLKEGQDLKGAYESFLEVLKIEPTNSEALNEVDDIKNQLESKSKKIYREGIIAESLSLFTDAKEKFQEVQQISPTDSEYYKKATEKLKNYME
ncbi:MAG: FHA domain-containing protein [Bacteriovoracaceae bacterium]